MSAFRAALLALLVPAAAFAGATASNFKPEHRKGANYWNAASAIDGDPATAWMVPGESPNRGEWVILDLPRGTVDRIGMNIGWIRDDESFMDYARVKTVKIEVFSMDDQQALTPRGTATATFEDKPDWQVVDIPDLAVGEDLFGGKVKISVVDIYEGKDYPNLAVSELLVYLAEFDAEITLGECPDSVGPNTQELMRDGNAKTFYATAAQGAVLTVQGSSMGISSLGIQGGPKTLGRPKTIEITANNRTITHTLPDVPGLQWVQVPTITGYTGGAFGDIEVKIVDTWPGTEPGVGIAELKARATNAEAF